MSKYKILKEQINAWKYREHENLAEAQRLAGNNSPGFAMALGAIEAYDQVLSDIEELESCIVIPGLQDKLE